MVEDGSNGGSGSPSPGDTLPWNLEKTQRSRRGGGGPGGNGSVLDPAERAVIRIAGNAQELGLSGSSALTRWLSPCCVFCAGLLESEKRPGAACRAERASRSRVTAGSTAPPAGRARSAARGRRWSLRRAPCRSQDEPSGPSDDDPSLGCWGRAASQGVEACRGRTGGTTWLVEPQPLPEPRSGLASSSIEYLNHLEYIKCKTIKILHTNNKAIQIGKNSCNLMT